MANRRAERKLEQVDQKLTTASAAATNFEVAPLPEAGCHSKASHTLDCNHAHVLK